MHTARGAKFFQLARTKNGANFFQLARTKNGANFFQLARTKNGANFFQLARTKNGATFFQLAALVASLVVAASACRSEDDPLPDASVARDAAPQGPTAVVQILAVTDLHGHLEPARDGDDTGGLVYLPAHLDRLRAENPNTILVGSGDFIGTTPFYSGYFQDEPAIEAINQLGLELTAAGNHDFDRGSAGARRAQELADFTFLSANVLDRETGETVFPAYAIRELGGFRVAFIGAVIDALRFIAPIPDLIVNPISTSVKRVIDTLESDGNPPDAIVLLVHDGAFVANSTPPEGCVNPNGDFLTKVLDRLDRRVDVILSGHTHRASNCTLGHWQVTNAGFAARNVTQALLTFDLETRRLIDTSAINIPVTHDVARDPAIDAILDRLRPTIEAEEKRVVGTITASITDALFESGDSALGNLLADAYLAATASTAGAQIAVQVCETSEDLSYRPSGDETAPGQVTFREAFEVEPYFNDTLTTITLSGGDVLEMIDSGLDGFDFYCAAGLSYSWSATTRRVDPASVRVGGEPLDRNALIRLTVNSHSEGRPPFDRGTDHTRGTDIVRALAAYLEANAPVPPPEDGRVVRLP